jgi:rhodanese-related sulfurtransferase
MTIAEPMPITATAAKRRAGALFVDIRPQVARHAGSITGALLLEPAAVTDRFNPKSPQRISGIDRSQDIVVCSVSSRRAIPTAKELRRMGYQNVYYIDGGYRAWVS